MDIIKRIENLENQMKNLASRPFTARAEEAKAEAAKAQNNIQIVNDEVIEAEVSMADFMEEYYLSQLGLDLEEGE